MYTSWRKGNWVNLYYGKINPPYENQMLGYIKSYNKHLGKLTKEEEDGIVSQPKEDIDVLAVKTQEERVDGEYDTFQELVFDSHPNFTEEEGRTVLSSLFTPD